MDILIRKRFQYIRARWRNSVLSSGNDRDIFNGEIENDRNLHNAATENCLGIFDGEVENDRNISQGKREERRSIFQEEIENGRGILSSKID